MDLVKTEQNADQAIKRVRLARHDHRPYASDFIARIFTDFCEIHGDRKFRDDPAVLCGLAKFQGRPIALIAHQKGRDVKDRQAKNFGMPKPDGYRKALRVMKIAEKFRRPILTLIDTPGAYPGIDAEERGQAEAIASNLREMARLKVSIIVTITGEGGSGGALAIGVGDVTNILENGIYSVISPEGCAAILWKDATKAPQAASSMRLTAPELLELGIVDHIIPEPEGGAQNDWDMAANYLAESLKESLKKVDMMSEDGMLAHRYNRFRQMGTIHAHGG
ncbi:MAG: acetyl-CoA carboxylase carboxyltransferase subunit alpha [Gammaproteobacteria bacterium]|nr:acetyl-CoA carboxylase carboxyltransferase subunit alpha [Gammaproteobacteria bacterium]